MSTYLDRWDPHLSDSIIFLFLTSGWERKNSYSLQPEVDFFDIGEVTVRHFDIEFREIWTPISKL